jgi:large repetitive protein
LRALKQVISLLVSTLVCGCANLANKQQTRAEAAPITVVPSSGKGQTAVVTVKLIPADVLRRVGILYNSELDGTNACYVLYNPADNTFGLVKDSGEGVESPIAEKPLVGNSQCALATGHNTRAHIKNNVLAISLAITFKPAFAGPRNVYVYEEYKDGRKPTFQKEGTWLVANESQTSAHAALITLVPSSGEGQSAVFTVKLVPADIVRNAGVLYNTYMEGRAACYIYYDPAKNNFGLIGDSGDRVDWLIAGKPLVENSQCALAGAGATRAEIDNNVLALSLAITFKPAFAGPRNIYIYEEYKDGGKPTFRQEGTWLVAP